LYTFEEVQSKHRNLAGKSQARSYFYWRGWAHALGGPPLHKSIVSKESIEAFNMGVLDAQGEITKAWI